MTPLWRLSPDKVWTLDRPRLLAILNVTPDSFSDGGQLPTAQAVARAARDAIDAGADGLDIGGESTRPGAQRVSASEQVARVVPAIIAARREVGDGPAITIDTTLEEVARQALDAGADAVNDVSAGTESRHMLTLCAQRRCAIVLMHRLAPPESDSYSTHYGRAGQASAPAYGDVVHEVGAYLSTRALAALDAGVHCKSICIDPGLGFGKTVAQNIELIERGAELACLGWPVLSGCSRKSFVGRAMNLPEGHHPRERAPGSVELALRHARPSPGVVGAHVLRVHDVALHARALRTAGLWPA
jgi:dihydropteroate synthase